MRQPPAVENISPAPLRHPVRVSALGREPEAENAVRLVPDGEARERITRFLEIEGVERMALTGRFSPISDGWEFRGQLTATVVQACVATLEPVRQTIDTAVRRRFIAGYASPEDTERVLSEEELDPPEPLDSEIDLGHVAVEALALSLDPYPRVEGAAVDPRHAGAPGAAADEPAEHPFAGLAELRARMSRKDG